VHCYNLHRKQQEVLKIAQREKKDNNHQIPNNHQVSEEDRLDMDKVKETDRSNGERMCVNGVRGEDEEQVTNLTEYKHSVTYTIIVPKKCTSFY
jgi:hypothetical protein